MGTFKLLRILPLEYWGSKYPSADAFISARQIHKSMIIKARDMCIVYFIGGITWLNQKGNAIRCPTSEVPTSALHITS